MAKKPPELRVVLDTNVLYSGTAHHLVTKEIADLIADSAKHTDLRLSWYLPDTVIGERRYQMRKEGEKLLPSIAKLERLLGHNLAMTSDLLSSRVDTAVEEQLSELAITQLQLDSDSVDWPEISRRAVERLPPFDDGEREKGFRDALICEAFCQLVSASPVTPDVCRVALVSRDERLREAAVERTQEARNVRVLATTDELKGLINTLVSAVGEEFVSTYRAKAGSYFFTKGEDGTLYYKEDVRERLNEEHGEALKELPSGATFRRNGTWFITAAEFVRKKKKRVTWSSVIDVEAIAYRHAAETQQQFTWPAAGELGSTGGNITIQGSNEPLIFSGSTGPLGGLGQSFTSDEPRRYFLPPSEVVVGKGRTSFDVQWSVSIGDDGVFRAPKIESIELLETTWDD